MKLNLFSIVILFSVCGCDFKRFTRCGLATELWKTNYIAKTFLGSWVCLTEKVSNRTTSQLGVSGSGKKSYGLFQIPERWCRVGKRGGECHIACEQLLDEDIRDDTECAVKIFNQEGFKYWSLWITRCKNDNLITKEIYKCPEFIFRRSSPDHTLLIEILRSKRDVIHHITTDEKWSKFYTIDIID